VALTLPKSLMMERSLELPGLSNAAADAAARLDLLRKTPFRPNEVYTLLAPLPGPNGRYRQYVIRKSDVSDVATRLAKLGLRTGPVLVEGEASGTLADLSDQWLPARKLWRRLNATLALGIIAALAWVWLSPGLAMRRDANLTSARVEALRVEATDLRAQVETARVQQQDQQAFLAGIIGRPRLVEVIRDLTVALPDEVWVSDMTFDGKTAVVSGEALGSAADLVLMLSKRREFTNPRLSGPVALMGSGVESFQLALDLGGAP
ncbi:MAG: PilN domain-containing protein, partial [Deltaproteobacteria bacterium]